MNTLDAINQRRSIRKFKQETISKELIEKVLDAAIKAPSAMNRQPWRFVVLEGTRKDELADILKRKAQKWRKIFKSAGFAEVTAENIKQAPVLILVFNAENRTKGLFRLFSNAMDVLDIQSIGAAIQNMILAAQELGLGTLWIGHIFFALKEMCRFVNKNEELVAAVAMGYADEEPSPRPRKSRSEITNWI